MFERYTEKARRVIFFARYEASQLGQPFIETEHLLLGILREDKALTGRFVCKIEAIETVRNQIVAHTNIREKVSTSVDLPLSNESKRVLAYAAEEAQRLGHKHIGTEHLLLGLMREKGSFAAQLLKERGLTIEGVRNQLAAEPHSGAIQTGDRLPVLSDAVRDLTGAASNGALEPVVGRERELEAVMEILLSRHRTNVMLTGERGCGKTALVELLAQRIADGAAPPWFAERRILAIEPEMLVDRNVERAAAQGGDAGPIRAAALQALEARLESLVRSAERTAIVLLDDLCDVLTAEENSALGQFGVLLKTRLLREEMQCIATATPERFRKAIQAAPWLGQCFRAVSVSTMDAEQTLAVLNARRQIYEKFHEVQIDDAALEFAARSASRYLPDSVLPGKALDLLDAAAARVKLGGEKPPNEMSEIRKRLGFIVKRQEAAVRNHEFEKARFYSDEERKERENLKAAEEKYGLENRASASIGVAEVEAVIARWGGYPYRPE